MPRPSTHWSNDFAKSTFPSSNTVKGKSNVKVPNLYGNATSDFRYGDLISRIIDFTVIALLVFVAYKQLSKRGIVEDKTAPEEKK